MILVPNDVTEVKKRILDFIVKLIFKKKVKDSAFDINFDYLNVCNIFQRNKAKNKKLLIVGDSQVRNLSLIIKKKDENVSVSSSCRPNFRFFVDFSDFS